MNARSLAAVLVVPSLGLVVAYVALVPRHGHQSDDVAAPESTEVPVASALEQATAALERVPQAGQEEAEDPPTLLVGEVHTVEPAPDPGDQIDFLPYPNNGEADFADKYDSLPKAELYYRRKILNEKLSALVDAEALIRYDSGLFSAHEPLTQIPEGATEQDLWPDKPTGLGRVWRCSRYAETGAGLELQLTYLTEVEYPEVFAKLDEGLYVSHLYYHKEKGDKH